MDVLSSCIQEVMKVILLWSSQTYTYGTFQINLLVTYSLHW